MGTRLQLALLAGVSGIVMLLLGYAARSATASLLEVPPQSWGTGHLSDAVVAGTCTIGALGALWHVASAALALVVAAIALLHAQVLQAGVLLWNRG